MEDKFKKIEEEATIGISLSDYIEFKKLKEFKDRIVKSNSECEDKWELANEVMKTIEFMYPVEE